MRAGVLREGLALTGAGLALGLGAAAALGRLLERLLYETSPIDPAVIAGLVALMALASLVACYLPARRAMRVEPTVALRAE
jgi:ABC-type lipoprotein release transport system permease subunit